MSYLKNNKQFKDHTETNSDPKKGISICIANVHSNISAARIKYAFIGFQLGFVERVDVVKTANPKFNRAYVHFAPGKWNMRDREAGGAYDVLCALQNGRSVKVEYEEGKPWFWKLQISRLPRLRQSKESYGKNDIYIKKVIEDPPALKRSETGEIVNDEKGKPQFKAYSTGRHSLETKTDKHSDASNKAKTSISYGRAKRNDKAGISDFLAHIEKKRTYESARKLAYENRKNLPETFEFPEEGAPEGVKKAFTRAVYRHLGM